MVVEVKYEDGEMRHVRASSVYVHQFLNPYSVDQSADVQGYHEVLIPVDRCGNVPLIPFSFFLFLFSFFINQTLP